MECFRLNHEVLLSTARNLNNATEIAVIAATGSGNDSIGDFVLNKEDSAGAHLVRFNNLSQDWRRNVVGQIPDDGDSFRSSLLNQSN